MWLARVECHAQRFAGSEEMLLTHDFIKGGWTQTLCQRRGHGDG